MAWTDWAGPIGMIAGAGIGAAGGAGASKASQRRQYTAQKKLTAMAIEGQKDISDYEQNLAYEMWAKTGPEAQAQQMRDAGLNVGLMYKQGGQGGRAVGADVGGIQTGQASTDNQTVQGMDIGSRIGQQAANIALTVAQKENIEADTALKKGQQPEKLEAEIGEITARTNNEKLKGEGINFENAIKQTEMEIAQKTADELVNQVFIAGQKLEGEAQEALRNGQIKAETAEDVIKQTKQATTEQQVRIASMKKGIQVDEQNIKVMARKIQEMNDQFRAEWRSWEQREKERWVQENIMRIMEKQANFNTDGMAEMKRLTDVVSTIISATPTPSGGSGRKIGF